MKDWQRIPCPIERTATLLADHYIIMIIRDLMEGPKRFRDLEAAGINPRTLAARLRHLQDAGFIGHRGMAETPAIAVYYLTEKGEALVPLIDFLRSYGNTWLPLSGSSL